MTRTITATAILALTAGAAAADGVNYARLSYDYNNFSVDSDDASIGIFQGDIEYSIDQFVLGAELEVLTTDADDDDTFVIYDIWGGYAATPEVLVGLGLTGSDDDVEDTQGAQAFGQFVTGQFGVGIRVSKEDLDEDNITTDVFGNYNVAPEIKLGLVLTGNSEFDGTGYIASADYDDGQIDARAFFEGNTEFDAGQFGVRGNYKVADAFRASAAFATNSGDDAADATAFLVGGGYEFADGAWVDLGIGQIDFEDADTVDRIEVSVSFETGDRKRLDNQFEQDRFDDLTSTFLVSF